MRIKIYINFFLFFFISLSSYSQTLRFLAEPAPFSTRMNDEFSPVFYKDGVVFCSNQGNNNIITYNPKEGKLFKIFIYYNNNKSKTGIPSLFSKEINSGFNDGPVTFNEAKDVLYFSRNNIIDRHSINHADPSNKLGIYSAELIDGVWANFKSFPYNDDNWNCTTPALSADGKRIYFSSDRPGGYGEMDLYYCEMNDNEWNMPVNLGPAINTPKNESFPFASKSGKLFFSSDGHPGFGGKDIYYTWLENDKWVEPVHLDSSINSPADDFGIVTDSLFEKGYFSTNRRNSDDIFEFRLREVYFSECIEIEENNYCFTFWDDNQNILNNDSIFYEWDFGQGIKIVGKEAAYCFPGPGHYIVKLTIRDIFTGDTITNQMEYNVAIDNIEQAEISSIFLCEAHEPIEFKAFTKDIPNFQVQNYYWDTGEGFKPGEASQLLTLDEARYHIVKLGLIGKVDSLNDTIKYCYQKRVRVHNKGERQLFNKKKGGEDSIGKASQISYPVTRIISEIYTMKGLTSSQESLIRKHLSDNKTYEVKFDQFRLSSDSYYFLNSLSEILISDENISVEILLHAGNESFENDFNTLDLFLQEIRFYMKKQGVQEDNIHLSIFRSSSDIIKNSTERRRSTNMLEFIIFNKEYDKGDEQ